MDLMKTTRAVDCDVFVMRVRAASMVVAAEKSAATTASTPERAMASQMLNNAGRPPESLAWLVAAQPEVNDLISVDEELTVHVDNVTDDVIIAATRAVWPVISGGAA